MAAARPAAQGPSIVPVVLGLTVVAAVAGIWFGLPGLVLLPFGIMTAAFVAPVSVLTGKKDAQGAPTAASPGEEKAMNRYRMWSELKWKAITPSADWLPGWPIRLWWLTALFLGGAAIAFPTPAVGGAWRFADAAGVFIAIVAANGALRKWTAPDDACPGPTLNYVIDGFKQGPKMIAAAGGALAAAVVVFLVTLVVINKFVPATALGHIQPWMVGTALGLAAATTVLALVVRGDALAQWRTMVRVRADWTPRWQVAKIDPVPRLIGYEEVGNITVASFEISPLVGKASVEAAIDKIQATAANATKVAVLDMPALDSQGQPQEGTKHPSRLRIATFQMDDLPDVNNPETDINALKMMIDGAMSWTAAGAFSRWILLDVQPLHDTNAPAKGGDEETEDDDDADEYDYEDDDE